MGRLISFSLFVVMAIIALIVRASALNTVKLKEMNIEGSVTVSGLSSGGFMAVQMHVAFSKVLNGSAIFAGGPYFCATGSLSLAEEKCMYGLGGGPNLDFLIKYTKDQAALQTIDAPTNLADDKIFLFSGSKDTVVNSRVVRTLEDYYGEFLSSNSQISTKYNLYAEHCIPTLDYGEACSRLASPYIGDCKYDGAGVALQHMYGGETQLTAPTKDDIATAEENLFVFDQTEFFPKGSNGVDISLSSKGYVYIPPACADGATACKLHMSFHGCSQNEKDIGDDYARHGGFNSWAQANNIVVVYPYTVPNIALSNPNACWDWWGYTDASFSDVTYALQEGVQMKFAKDILDRIMG